PDCQPATLEARKAGAAGNLVPEADPRIGPERFARKLSLTLSAAADADAVLVRAEADLDRVSEQITELAARITGQISGTAGPGAVPRVLGRLAEDVPDDATILEF